MGGMNVRPKDFEDAVLDLVAAVSEAETKCAARLSLLSDDGWAFAKATIQHWINNGANDFNWRHVLELAEYERAPK